METIKAVGSQDLPPGEQPSEETLDKAANENGHGGLTARERMGVLLHSIHEQASAAVGLCLSCDPAAAPLQRLLKAVADAMETWGEINAGSRRDNPTDADRPA